MAKPQFVAHKDINKEKWDRCINQAANGLIYGESVYLDLMTAHWDGIIIGDYEAVMPLCWKMKWGIKYLYQPAFLQQGGLFSLNEIDEQMLLSCLAIAMQHFRFAEFTLNHANPIPFMLKNASSLLRQNFILPLHHNYDTLYHQYHSDTRQSLKKASQYGMIYQESQNIHLAISCYRDNYQQRLPEFSPADYAHFEALCLHYQKKNRVLVAEVSDSRNGSLLAIALLLTDGKRWYNLVSCCLPEGRKKLANYFLYDALIQEKANSNLVLDLEGSDLPGIAFFYQKLGAGKENYPFVKYNHLPAVIQLFKR